ncbi:MAG: flagellar biosynthesis anti-sigma factor FlgM [Pseudobdellovibrio sp.]
MKITHNKIGQNLNLSDSSKAEKSSGKDKVSGAQKSQNSSAVDALKDLGSASDATKINLSERSQDLKQIKELATAAPDVDQAKVDKFRRLIDEGKYKTDSKSIADKMVDEHLFSTGGASNE